jgi:hypothetical protein
MPCDGIVGPKTLNKIKTLLEEPDSKEEAKLIVYDYPEKFNPKNAKRFEIIEDLVIEFEEYYFRSEAHQINEDTCTIGYKHTKDVKIGMQVTKQ